MQYHGAWGWSSKQDERGQQHSHSPSMWCDVTYIERLGCEDVETGAQRYWLKMSWTSESTKPQGSICLWFRVRVINSTKKKVMRHMAFWLLTKDLSLRLIQAFIHFTNTSVDFTNTYNMPDSVLNTLVLYTSYPHNNPVR